MSEITIVSAFFNINRSNWAKFGRSDEQYFEYFKLWGKIKNKLVVYVETEELKNRIVEFRMSLGLGEKTKVVLVTNYQTIDSDLYDSIKKITMNKEQQEFRTKPKNPEVWNCDYDYIMLLKMWCVQDAVQKGYANGTVAWVDFGYLHGGKSSIDPKSDFNFLWSYDFDDKINVFLIQDLDDKPIFEIVQNMDTYIMGTILVAPDNLWNTFWLAMRNNMIGLNKCGLVDDDQTIILMCYRENPNLFTVHKSAWGLPMQQFGGNHLKLKTETEKRSVLSWGKSKLRYVKKTILNFQYAFIQFKKLQKLDRK